MPSSADSTAPPARRAIPRRQAVDALVREAGALYKAGQLEDAAARYAQALSLQPDHAQAANNLGVVLRAGGRYEAAEALYRRVLARVPDTPGAWVNLGNVLRDLGRLSDAEAAHRRALNLAPETRSALYGLGLVYRDAKRLDESIACLERVLAQTPDDAEVQWDLAQSCLCAGDYRRGFAAYEARWRLPGVTRPDAGLPEWDGSPLAGRRLLLYGEQGFGDVLQFTRLLPLVLRTGGTVVLQVRAPLVALLSGQMEGVAVIPPDAPPTGCDLQAPLLSVPWLLGLERADIPAAPYLRAPARSQAPLPPTLPEVRRRIGLCWQGSPTQKNDRNRSLPFPALLPLLARPELSFVNLQTGPAARAPATQGIAPLVPGPPGGLADFAETAAVIDALDLVITVDTSVLHVAGALGKPVWVLLSVFHDWRFDAADSIADWYPSVRVFKQHEPGDWAGVVARVLAALDEEDTP